MTVKSVIQVLISICLASVSMAQNQPQLTQVPPKPTCTLIFKTGSCADLWRNYNQAIAQRQREELQIYIDRQKEQASAAAAAPLQAQIENITAATAQQIEHLTKVNSDQLEQMKKLQSTMQAEAVAASEAKASAEQDAFLRGVLTGFGGALFLVLVFFGIKKIASKYTVAKKPNAAAASA